MISDVCLMEIHAICNAIGWFILIPAGVWMSTMGRTSHPSKWRCYHGIIMLLATIIILAGSYCAYRVIGLPFNTLHTILGPILCVLLVLQVIVGIVAYFRRGHMCNCMIHTHRVSGLCLYLGGLVNGFVGAFMYSQMIISPLQHDLLALGTGFMAAVQLYLLWHVIPIWWSHLRGNDLSYEAIEDQVA